MDALFQRHAVNDIIAKPLAAAGFRHLEQAPPLADRFVIVDLRDVTEGPYYGYHWQLRAVLVVATGASGPWRLDPGMTGDVIADGHEGVVELASVAMTPTSFTGVIGQIPELADRIRVHYEHTTVPPKWHVWNEVARAEWYRRKAEGARQGVWDRLYRDGLLEDMDREERAALVEWAVQFGADPMVLRSEQSVHDRALWPIRAARS